MKILALDPSTQFIGYFLKDNEEETWGVISRVNWEKDKSSVYKIISAYKEFYNFNFSKDDMPITYIEKSTANVNLNTTQSLGGVLYGILNIHSEENCNLIRNKEFIDEFLKPMVKFLKIESEVFLGRTNKDGSPPKGLKGVETKRASILIANFWIKNNHPDKPLLELSGIRHGMDDISDAINLYCHQFNIFEHEIKGVN